MSTNRYHGAMDCYGCTSSTSVRRGRPTIRVSTVEGSTVVEFKNAEFLFAEEDIAELAGPLRRLVDAGHTQLVLDLSGVRSMSSDVLAMVADLQRRLERVGGRLRIVRADAAVRDMLRICRLDRYLTIEPDEAGRGSRAKVG
jgi:anti-anti-sigma factor